MNRADCAHWLQSHDNYLILTHRRPDGDTLGSAAALCLMLRRLGKTAHILENPEITAKYAPLHEGLCTPQCPQDAICVCVDVAAAELLTDKGKTLQTQIALRIDHHASAAPFTPLELVDPAAGACGEIIFDLISLLQVNVDIPIAKALYTAVSTDTGCFRYANTTAHSFRVAAACYESGADLQRINLALFDTNSLAKLRLQGWMAENTRLLCGGRVAVCALPLSVEQELGVTEDDMDGISGFPRSIEGVCIAAMLRQSADGGIKVSMRAIPGYDAAAVCAKLGGGGHKGAAGVSMRMPLEKAAQIIEKAMLELFE